MEIIFTETWMAWAVGILLSLVALKILIIIFILIAGLRILKKLDSLIEEFSEWSSYAMDEATATIDDLSRLRKSLKNYLSVAGIIAFITRIFKQFNKRRG